MMLVVLAMTGLGLFLAQRKVAIEAAWDLQQDFRNELATLHGVQELRYAALAERCRDARHATAHPRRARRQRPGSPVSDARETSCARSWPADGRLPRNNRPMWSMPGSIAFSTAMARSSPRPVTRRSAGFSRKKRRSLRLPSVPNEQQDRLPSSPDPGWRRPFDEVIAMPINSTENGAAIAALVLGLKPVELGSDSRADGDRERHLAGRPVASRGIVRAGSGLRSLRN